MKPRPEFTRRTKAEAFTRAAGACEECGTRLSVGKFAYDHVLPAALGGSATLENCCVLCVGCHAAKTGTEDIPRIRKADRQRASHIGAKQRGGGWPTKTPQRRASGPIRKWAAWRSNNVEH